MAEQTFWNGEPCPARRVVVRVETSPAPSWWCSPLEGQERRAVEVRYHPGHLEQYYGQPFFLDDDEWTPELEAHRVEQRRLNPKIDALTRAGGQDPDRVPPGAGCGWWKVTEGRGGPDCYHRSLPDDSVVVGEVSA